MVAAVLSVGTELTRGEVVDSNSLWIASRLAGLGFDVHELCCVDGDVERVHAAIVRLAASARVLLVTGGLGPTPEDVTARAAARAAGVDCATDEATLETIRRRLQAQGRPLNTASARQAVLPRGAEVLGNPLGTAPAFRLAVGGADAYFLPDVPDEAAQIFDELVARRIGPHAASNSYQVVLRTYGPPESVVSEKLAGLEALVPGLRVGYRVDFPEVHVKLLVHAADVVQAKTAAERAATEARARLGAAVYGDDQATFAGAVGRALRSQGYTLAVAESCTGGLIGSLLTAVPGSSDYLLLDAVAYSNAAKERVLGVPAEVLRGHGAVSPECARAMAEGARRLTDADLAVAVSGIAGPSGGTVEKPVGLVFIALSTPWGTEVVERSIAGDRARVQRGAAYVALEMVREACRGATSSSNPSVCG